MMVIQELHDSVFNKSTTGFRSETQEFADADPRG